MNKEKSVALLFPGQGSQYVGMGKNLPSFFFEEADQILDFPLSKIMMEGPMEKLTLTTNAQPAILTHSIALYHRFKSLLEKNGFTIKKVLGHSVGEYAALVAAGSLNFKDALKAVHWRGTYMQEATPLGSGTMIAILNVPEEIIHQACLESSSKDNKAFPANYNTVSQIVISGHTQACRQTVKWLKEHYPSPFRSIELKVSAPFHSSLMAPASKKLKEKLHHLTFLPVRYPYIANLNATEYPIDTPGSTVKDNLIEQITRPVLWHQSMKQIPSDTLCLECGPGQTLTKMAEKIDKTFNVVPLDKEDAYEKCKEILS